MREIIPVPGVWIEKERFPRKDEVVRMGHSLLTHGYLMNDDVPDVAPHCELCNSAILTIKHVMLECEQLSHTRRDCLKMCRRNRAPNMRDLLGKNMKFFEVICFLKNIEAYNLI